MRRVLGLLTLLSSLSASGAGTMNLNGKVQSLTPEHIVLSDGRHEYQIARTYIAPVDKQKLAKLRSGDQFELWVPFDGITAVKELRTK